MDTVALQADSFGKSYCDHMLLYLLKAATEREREGGKKKRTYTHEQQREREKGTYMRERETEGKVVCKKGFECFWLQTKQCQQPLENGKISTRHTIGNLHC